MSLKVNGQIITDSTSSYIQLPVGGDNLRPGTPVPGMIRYNTQSTSVEVYSTYLQNGVPTSSWQTLYTASGYSSTPINSEALFTTPTTVGMEDEWIVPAGVTTIAVICVGGGGGGAVYSQTDTYVSGGGGGALAYANYIDVIPGSRCKLFVGAAGSAANTNGSGTDGGDSYFKIPDPTTLGNYILVCRAGGGKKGLYISGITPAGGKGGTFTSISGGGGNGGDGGAGPGGGGGAGGYLGSGGTGGPGSAGSGGLPAANSGGGGGGGGNSGGGGGVGIYGIGSTPTTASTGQVRGLGGSGGIGGTITPSGGAYGGGGGGDQTGPGNGGPGVVRIVWGPGLSNRGRQFPSESVGAL